MRVYFILILLALFTSSCATKKGHQFLAKTSQDELSKILIKGQTTKEQITTLYGTPSDIDILQHGKEYWVYSFVRADLKGVNYVPYVNLLYNGTNDNIRKLKILFTKEGVVESFVLIDSVSETKSGIFQ